MADEIVPADTVKVGETTYNIRGFTHGNMRKPLSEELEYGIEEQIEHYLDKGHNVYLEQNLGSNFEIDHPELEEICDHDVKQDEEYSEVRKMAGQAIERMRSSVYPFIPDERLDEEQQAMKEFYIKSRDSNETAENWEDLQELSRTVYEPDGSFYRDYINDRNQVMADYIVSRTPEEVEEVDAFIGLAHQPVADLLENREFTEREFEPRKVADRTDNRAAKMFVHAGMTTILGAATVKLAADGHLEGVPVTAYFAGRNIRSIQQTSELDSRDSLELLKDGFSDVMRD